MFGYLLIAVVSGAAAGFAWWQLQDWGMNVLSLVHWQNLALHLWKNPSGFSTSIIAVFVCATIGPLIALLSLFSGLKSRNGGKIVKIESVTVASGEKSSKATKAEKSLARQKSAEMAIRFRNGALKGLKAVLSRVRGITGLMIEFMQDWRRELGEKQNDREVKPASSGAKRLLSMVGGFVPGRENPAPEEGVARLPAASVSTTMNDDEICNRIMEWYGAWGNTSGQRRPPKMIEEAVRLNAVIDNRQKGVLIDKFGMRGLSAMSALMAAAQHFGENEKAEEAAEVVAIPMDTPDLEELVDQDVGQEEDRGSDGEPAQKSEFIDETIEDFDEAQMNEDGARGIVSEEEAEEQGPDENPFGIGEYLANADSEDGSDILGESGRGGNEGPEDGEEDANGGDGPIEIEDDIEKQALETRKRESRPLGEYDDDNRTEPGQGAGVMEDKEGSGEVDLDNIIEDLAGDAAGGDSEETLLNKEEGEDPEDPGDDDDPSGGSWRSHESDDAGAEGENNEDDGSEIHEAGSDGSGKNTGTSDANGEQEPLSGRSEGNALNSQNRRLREIGLDGLDVQSPFIPVLWIQLGRAVSYQSKIAAWQQFGEGLPDDLATRDKREAHLLKVVSAIASIRDQIPESDIEALARFKAGTEEVAWLTDRADFVMACMTVPGEKGKIEGLLGVRDKSGGAASGSGGDATGNTVSSGLDEELSRALAGNGRSRELTYIDPDYGNRWKRCAAVADLYKELARSSGIDLYRNLQVSCRTEDGELDSEFGTMDAVLGDLRARVREKLEPMQAGLIGINFVVLPRGCWKLEASGNTEGFEDRLVFVGCEESEGKAVHTNDRSILILEKWARARGLRSQGVLHVVLDEGARMAEDGSGGAAGNSADMTERREAGCIVRFAAWSPGEWNQVKGSYILPRTGR